MNVFDVLQKANYYIKYNYLKKSNSAILSFVVDNDPFELVFRFDNKSNTLFMSNGKRDKAIPCSARVAPLVVKAYLHRIAKIKNYPIKYIIYQRDGNIVNTGFSFQESEKLSKDFVYLLWDIIDCGLTDEHIAIAKDEGIWEEMKSFIAAIWPIEIVDKHE